MINYYESLGVEVPASADEIKSAYRTLVKRYHPDVPGGDPVRFARVAEAYEVLSEPARRKTFDDAWRAHTMQRDARMRRPAGGRAAPAYGPPPSGTAQGGPGGPAGATPGTGPKEAPEDAGPPFTRIMSMPLAAGGRFLLEGLHGEFTILPTSAEDIWETTRQKFAGEDPAALARKVVQIRVHGPRELVKQLRLLPTGFGIQLQGMEKEQFLGGPLEGGVGAFLNPRAFRMEQLLGHAVQLTATVPAGSPVYLYDLTGKITVGDLNAELVANLDERTFLRAGAISAANINLNGQSRAHLTRLEGAGDVLLFGQSQMLIGGNTTRLRAVLEHEGHLEIAGNVEWLQATVGGRSYLNAKGTIDRAHCDVRAGAYVRLAKVKTAVQGTRSGSAGFDVIEGPPPQSIFGVAPGLGPRPAPGMGPLPAPRKAPVKPFRGGLL